MADLKKTATESKPKTVSRREEVVKRMAEIEKEYGGFSNIPTKHEYWDLRNELAGLN